MTESSSWAAAFSALEATGVRVRVYVPSARLYIHAKIVVVDPRNSAQRAFVGSENFSVTSLLYTGSSASTRARQTSSPRWRGP